MTEYLLLFRNPVGTDAYLATPEAAAAGCPILKYAGASVEVRTLVPFPQPATV